MAKALLNNCGIYLGGYELSGYSNAVALELQKDLHDATTFGAGSRQRVPGLTDARFSCAGCLSPVEVGAVLNDKMTTTDEIITLAAENSAAGVAYMLRGVEGDYSLIETVNDVAKWTMTGTASISPIVRGNILHRATAAVVTGTSTPQQLGANTIFQSLYATLHVFSIVGTGTPSLTVIVQSDNGVGFATPVTRLTFPVVTDVTLIGGLWQQSILPGAVADDWWRIQYTISGTNPSFGFVAAMGIL
jgi:hypothetical protein